MTTLSQDQAHRLEAMEARVHTLTKMAKGDRLGAVFGMQREIELIEHANELSVEQKKYLAKCKTKLLTMAYDMRFGPSRGKRR